MAQPSPRLRAAALLFATALPVGLLSMPALADDDDLTVASLNVLHGLGCDPDQCRLSDRIDLLLQWIDDAGCPDVVTLQEVNDLGTQIKARQLILAGLPTLCGGQYDGQTVYANVLGVDEEMVLSSSPILKSQVEILHSGLAPGFTRHALFVRLNRTTGPIDIFTTHLSSGGDDATEPCGVSCPAVCTLHAATTFRECQAVQLLEFVSAVHDIETPAIVTGDMNAEPGSYEYDKLTSTGWIDTFLAAGNAECNAGTGAGCTSGRADSLTELESTADNVDRRIDYAFLVPPPEGSRCNYQIDGPGDDDADGTATRVFADDPNPFETCGASPLPVCWSSDHEGNELDVNLFGCEFTPIPALPNGALLLLASLFVVAAALVSTRLGSRTPTT